LLPATARKVLLEISLFPLVLALLQLERLYQSTLANPLPALEAKLFSVQALASTAVMFMCSLVLHLARPVDLLFWKLVLIPLNQPLVLQ
jgi:hypothetical protein